MVINFLIKLLFSLRMCYNKWNENRNIVEQQNYQKYDVIFDELFKIINESFLRNKLNNTSKIKKIKLKINTKKIFC